MKRKAILEQTSGGKKDSPRDPGSSSGTERRTIKSYVIERDIPKVHGTMTTDLVKIDNMFSSNKAKVDQIMNILKAIPVTETNDDKPLLSYIRSLQSRWQLALKWQGLHKVVKLFNLGADDGNSAATSPGCASAASTPGGCSPAILSDTEMVEISLKDLAEREKARKPFGGDPANIKSRIEMQTMQEEGIWEVNTSDELGDFMETWEQCISIATELIGSVKTTCGYIESHVTQKRKRVERERKDQEKKAQQLALQKVREEAAQAAAAIRAKAKQPLQDEVQTRRLIFEATWADVKSVDIIAEVPDCDSETWNSPFLVQESDNITLLVGNSGLQKELASWATAFRNA
eukprot:6600844-Pyramimonas_sp.AAC.1